MSLGGIGRREDLILCTVIMPGLHADLIFPKKLLQQSRLAVALELVMV